jgi:hypothetical protein
LESLKWHTFALYVTTFTIQKQKAHGTLYQTTLSALSVA